MNGRNIGCLIVMALSCSLLSAQTDSNKGPKNRVIVMGMIHGDHRTSEKYGLEKVKSLIREIRPDYVFCEIPPDRIELATRQFSDSGTITEPRVKVFPEYVDALFPLTGELDFEIVPCAGWTQTMSDQRQKKLAELEKTHPEQFREMVDAQSQADTSIEKEGASDDPTFIHSDQYDTIVKKGMEPYNRHFNEILGAGGWDNINKTHFDLIARNLDKLRGKGKTVLIMFGAGHKYWFLEQLKKREDIELFSLGGYLSR